MQTIAESKVTGFTIGAQKRSNPFQKHKEEAEMKRRKESEEAAKAYEDFVASFEVPDKKEKKFVKGKSTFVPTTSVFGQEDDDEEENKDLAEKAKAAYKPQAFSGTNSNSNSSSASSPAKTTLNFPGQEFESTASATPFVKDTKAKRRQNMDAFFEELKRNQAEREERGVNPHQPSRPSMDDVKAGSRDTGDPHTTNLYIGNINPTVNEEQLCLEFARYGPIASIKIMWPRTTEEIERNRNCGFVSFMERSDAAVALREMEGMVLMGYEMKLGWGKAVPLPAVPFFVSKDYVPPLKAAKVPVRKSLPRSSTDVVVTLPTDPQTFMRIHRVIEKILVVGYEFEQALIEKESHNPSFSFLVDFKSSEHIYYRWKLYSLMQGDTTTRWRTEPFKMVQGGPVWVPPLMQFTDEVFEEDERLVDAHEEEFEKAAAKGTLSRGARAFFEAQLRLMTSTRRSIGKGMMFCMLHADAADEIVDVLVNSMLLPNTPHAVRIARLYLISDILHNCSVPLPSVWKFRSALESKLPQIFEAFNAVYRNIDARLKAEQFRRQVSNILAVWENWIVFPQTYIDNLSSILMRKEPESGGAASISTAETAAGATSDTITADQSSVVSVAARATAANLQQDEDLDGEPLKEDEEDLDGEPLNDMDLDGEPMNDGDLDGVPMDDEDIDGEPMD
ncbi:U2 snRNP-associated SURP domain-containing protein [Gryganskiella cystojenkinii]|nr:U2 snRNP-associated SURP domain-containing protein [Gryganskiella cystojenkinii]